MKFFRFVLCVGTSWTLLIGAKADPPPLTPPAIEVPKSTVDFIQEKARQIAQSPDGDYNAEVEVQLLQGALHRILLQEFQSLDTLPQSEKRKIEGRYHDLIRTLGQLRAQEARSALIEIADLQLDPSTAFPGYCDWGASSYYPAAFALVEIGGPELQRDLLLKLGGGILPENKVRAYGWILARILGRDVLLFIVNQKLAESAKIGRRPEENLLLLKTILEAKDSLLRSPNNYGVNTAPPKTP